MSARQAVSLLSLLSHAWQCMSCQAWFESDTPSQLCPSCGG